MKILKQNITIKSVSKDTIARAEDVFSWIDSDFENWNTNKKSPKTDKIKVAVLEQEKDGTFNDIFNSISTDLDSLCLTQAQIIEFVKTYKAELNQDWYNFFLFKVATEFFVARVRVRDGELEVYVGRFSDDGVWGAEFRRRFVVPQLALGKIEDKMTLRPLDSSALCPNCGCKLEIMIKK